MKFALFGLSSVTMVQPQVPRLINYKGKSSQYKVVGGIYKKKR